VLTAQLVKQAPTGEKSVSGGISSGRGRHQRRYLAPTYASRQGALPDGPAGHRTPNRIPVESRWLRPSASCALQTASWFAAAARGTAGRLPYQADMQRAFGERFDDVAVYLGRAESLAPLGVDAATRGEAIVFAESSPERETVAHELAHVVQNRANAVPGSSMSSQGDSSETEAQQAALRAAGGNRVGALSARPTGWVQGHYRDNPNESDPYQVAQIRKAIAEQTKGIVSSYVSVEDARALGFVRQGPGGYFPENWTREGGFWLMIVNRGQSLHPAHQKMVDAKDRVTSLVGRIVRLVDKLTDLRAAGEGESQRYEMALTEADGYVSELDDLVTATDGERVHWRKSIEAEAPKQLEGFDNAEHSFLQYHSNRESLRTLVDSFAADRAAPPPHREAPQQEEVPPPEEAPPQE
jgi:hypothetical protein